MSKRNIRRTAEQWKTIIDQQSHSGLGAREFCEQRNLGLSTFSKWKRRLQLDSHFERKQSAGAMPAFQPVEIVPNASVASAPVARISLRLDEGITLSIERGITAS